jgi:hypothetical protein
LATSLLGFETKVLYLLGLDPTHQPATSANDNALRALAESDWSTLGTLVLPQPQLKELSAFLQTSLASALSRIPKSRAGAWRALVAGDE